MTLVTSEFDMGAGQVPKEGRRGLLSLFSATSKRIHCFGRVPLTVGIVSRKKGYVK